MKLILVIPAILCLASAEIFNGNDWKQVKSPLDSPRYHEIFNKLFPVYNTVASKINRGGRIAGGELARIGQFVHQALLLTVDTNGDNFICGGSIITHNWILTVKFKA
jgi:hypothetical protein